MDPPRHSPIHVVRIRNYKDYSPRSPENLEIKEEIIEHEEREKEITGPKEKEKNFTGYEEKGKKEKLEDTQEEIAQQPTQPHTNYPQPSTSSAQCTNKIKIYNTETTLTPLSIGHQGSIQETRIEMNPNWTHQRILSKGLKFYLQACQGQIDLYESQWMPILNAKHTNVLKFYNIGNQRNWHCVECNKLIAGRSEYTFLPEIVHSIEPECPYKPAICHLCGKDAKTRENTASCINCIFHFAVFGPPLEETLVSIPCSKINQEYLAAMGPVNKKEKKSRAPRTSKRAKRD